MNYPSKTVGRAAQTPVASHRRLIVTAVVAAIALVYATAAVARGTALIWVTHAGVTCGYGTGPQGRGVACTRTDKVGYGVTLTEGKVIVWRGDKVVFERSNHQ